MRPYSPGGSLIALAAALVGSIPPTPSDHRLRRGLPGYLIPFAPHAFAPQRQGEARELPSPLVFLLISTHFTATPGIPLSPLPLKNGSSRPLPRLSRGLSGPAYHSAYALFTPSKSGQRLPPTYYRGCWHVVSRGFFLGYRPFSSPRKRALHPEGLPHPRGVAASGLPPLRKIPHCCLPKESGPCLSPRPADHPLRPATRRRLGGPLPRQRADRPQTHLPVQELALLLSSKKAALPDRMRY